MPVFQAEPWIDESNESAEDTTEGATGWGVTAGSDHMRISTGYSSRIAF